MDIIRASFGDARFSAEQTENGACAFYTQDGGERYFFQINGREATVFASGETHLDEAVCEFLFYSGFISRILRADGSIVFERAPVDTRLMPICGIQPSQFYINRRKLDACRRWMERGAGVYIPVADIDGAVVALDGHTRLRAAMDLGLDEVYIYHEPHGEYIEHFMREAKARGVHCVADMPLLSEDEYKEKWHKFCDDFFSDK